MFRQVDIRVRSLEEQLAQAKSSSQPGVVRTRMLDLVKRFAEEDRGLLDNYVTKAASVFAAARFSEDEIGVLGESPPRLPPGA